MKVLFVCRQNVGRSQMAKAFYNSLTHSHDASSAGTHVDQPGQTLQERKATSSSKNFFVLDVMNEIDIDMSQYKRTLLDEAPAKDYDLIVGMTKAHDVPKWLLDSPKYIHWNIADPRDQNYANTVKIRDEIKNMVEELIANYRT